MRQLFLSVLLLAVIPFAGIHAQTKIKLGHVNSQELIAAMPESDSAQAQLRKHTQQLETQLEKMQVELNNKYENYINEAEEMSDLIRQTRETELQEMQQRIQQFQMTAEQDLQNTRTKLFRPIFDKANKAIAEVAKENNFMYIFDSGSGALVYQSPESEDIMPLVKAKLGIE